MVWSRHGTRPSSEAAGLTISWGYIWWASIRDFAVYELYLFLLLESPTVLGPIWLQMFWLTVWECQCEVGLVGSDWLEPAKLQAIRSWWTDNLVGIFFLYMYFLVLLGNWLLCELGLDHQKLLNWPQRKSENAHSLWSKQVSNLTTPIYVNKAKHARSKKHLQLDLD